MYYQKYFLKKRENIYAQRCDYISQLKKNGSIKMKYRLCMTFSLYKIPVIPHIHFTT